MVRRGRFTYAVPVRLFYGFGLVERERWAKGRKEEDKMDLLWTLAVILLILWLLGLVTSFTLGGFIHILLVVAIIAVLIRVIQGRRAI